MGFRQRKFNPRLGLGTTRSHRLGGDRSGVSFATRLRFLAEDLPSRPGLPRGAAYGAFRPAIVSRCSPSVRAFAAYPRGLRYSTSLSCVAALGVDLCAGRHLVEIDGSKKMSDEITLTGLVATAPRHLVTSEGLQITFFRLATTARATTARRARGSTGAPTGSRSRRSVTSRSTSSGRS